MKKLAMILVILISVSFQALALNYGRIKINAPAGRYKVYIDNERYAPDQLNLRGIRVREGRHEVVVKDRKGKEVIRETLDIRKDKTSRIHVNARGE